MSLLTKELFSQLKPQPILAHDGLFMPEFPDEFAQSADTILRQALMQGIIPRETTARQETFLSPVIHTPIDIEKDLRKKRKYFFPDPNSETDDREWLMELYGCAAIAFTTTNLFFQDFNHFYSNRDNKVLDVDQTKVLLADYAKDRVWVYHQTKLLRAQSSVFNHLIENIARLTPNGNYRIGATLPGLEEEFIRSMHLLPLTGQTPKGKFAQVLELLSPGISDKTVPQFIEKTRKNTKSLLLGMIQSTGHGEGYTGKSLTDRLLDIQSQLLEGIPYELGLRTEPIKVGKVKLNEEMISSNLDSIEKSSSKIFREVWKTNLNYMMAYLWNNLIMDQPLKQGNKRSSFLATISYALEYGEADLVNTAFIPEMFVGKNDISSAISNTINHPECRDRTYIELLAEAIANSPKLTIEQYANLMFEKGYSFGN